MEGVMGVPTWMYRTTGAGLESAIFDSDDLPQGWHDAPPTAGKPPSNDVTPEAARVDAPKRRGRPPKQ
jgi:hypothetical protein